MSQTVRLNKILIYAREEAERLISGEIAAEHLLLGILRLGEGVAYDVLIAAGLNHEAAKQEIESALQATKKDTIQAPVSNAQVQRILRIADDLARNRHDEATGSKHLLLAILRERINRAAAYLESQWGITYDKIAHMVGEEQQMAAGPGPEAERVSPGKNTKPASTLEKYAVDITRRAEQQLLDPVVGREVEIQRVTQILARRRKNNPVLIGDPGVGKSAIVEGLAQQIVNGEAPALKGKRIVALDLASMVAGTTYRGQFEERMKNLIRDLTAHQEIILFIDEIHTIIGAGNAQGSLDAAGILKPALARGEIQCIGATTTKEYAKSIEKDGALERRFQKVMVRPTTKAETLQILERISEKYAEFHHVNYSEKVLEACVNLADRYLTDRAFPDKAIDVLDEVGAKYEGDITEDQVAAVVSMMSGVPVQRVGQSETERLLTMGDTLREKVIGQDKAIDEVVRAIRRSRMGLRDPHRPIGTFFFLGPTGVGKTLLAQTLAEIMFGSRDALIRFDMSEYQEQHTASLMVGAPPGYVAHEEGGRLTEAVRRHPYSIVLFDEIEKAHPDIFNLLLQLMDEGRLTDRQGRQVDFRNTIIIMTSNVGTRQLREASQSVGFDTVSTPDAAATQRILQRALERTFPPEFTGRLDSIVVFHPLSDESLHQILSLEIQKLADRLTEQGFSLEVSDEARRGLLLKSDSAKFGARPIRRAIQTHLEDQITEQMLTKKSKSKTIKILSL